MTSLLRITAVAALMMLCPVNAWTLEKMEASAFHSARSDTEKALAEMLKRADNDNNQLDNLMAGRGNAAFKQTLDYNELLTADLLDAIRTQEKANVNARCHGVYHSGEICGMDFSPITCGQDSPVFYLYKTRMQSADKAIIESKWPGDAKSYVTYHLVSNSGRWKMSAIACPQGTKFNM